MFLATGRAMETAGDVEIAGGDFAQLLGKRRPFSTVPTAPATMVSEGEEALPRCVTSPLCQDS